MRLHKYMAMCGVASRRKSEALILEGKVELNGEIVTSLGTMYKEGDKVKVNGQLISLEKKSIYIMLNKPLDCVTTAKDQFNRKTVLDFIKDIDERLYPVGRLDYNTTGLLLLTNDGDLAHKITHPSTHMDKKYIAKINGTPNEKALSDFRKGLMIDGKLTSKAEIQLLKSGAQSLVEVVIHEGRNRQVRKMLEQIGHSVITLKRVAIGALEIGTLKLGEYRHLTTDEVEYLKQFEVQK
ncbi:MAG: rRNA pseudouridine synthase [Clostridia bacterium]|nr:rRNA pseudouridine synthase [Clostridia bacterium]